MVGVGGYRTREVFENVTPGGTAPLFGSGISGFPLRLENLEKCEGIFQSGKSQEILNRLEKSGKSQGNHTKYWKTQEI